jgi:GT2 family glycosyltransferase
MKVLIAGLAYGNRPKDILNDNLTKAGYPYTYIEINTEGIANAMNEAIDIAGVDGYDAIAYLANDIIEPENWLAKKVEALQTYPSAGIVSSSLDQVRFTIQCEHIICNWLLSMEVVDKIGIFNESMFPYGPIDLDYCERANLAGFNTYYVKECQAFHQGSHATGNEYGWDKGALIDKYWKQHVEDVYLYRNGLKDLKYGSKRTRDKKV